LALGPRGEDVRRAGLAGRLLLVVPRALLLDFDLSAGFDLPPLLLLPVLDAARAMSCSYRGK
jgi:hypothetical protein